jgi:hypothetical protein
MFTYNITPWANGEINNYWTDWIKRVIKLFSEKWPEAECKAVRSNRVFLEEKLISKHESVEAYWKW